MKFTAGEFWLVIDYKIEGKFYNASKFAADANKDGTVTTAPFDTHTIRPGQTWELPEGAEFIQKHELRLA